MLVNKINWIVPRETPEDMLLFIDKNLDSARFLIGMFIPEGSRFTTPEYHILEGYFCDGWRTGELRLRTRANAHHYPIPYYGLDHIEFIIPNTKRDMKTSKNFWIKPGALKRMVDIPDRWHWSDFKLWVKHHPHIEEEQLHG